MSEKDLKPASVVNGSSLKSEVMKETQFVSEKLVIAVKMIGLQVRTSQFCTQQCTDECQPFKVKKLPMNEYNASHIKRPIFTFS